MLAIVKRVTSGGQYPTAYETRSIIKIKFSFMNLPLDSALFIYEAQQQSRQFIDVFKGPTLPLKRRCFLMAQNHVYR
jgi:hypothetical protein